ncbi:MAG TPA: myxosortase-dependent metalloprotease, MXAN_2677/MXAN_2678 family [Myxococcaceae bacterium]|nr:myxosortase-dependent metalloprotease, MXAN_2677/MXAN_2678 family [Myxococcaceae bacterium]
MSLALPLALALVLSAEPYVRTRVTAGDPSSHCLLWLDPHITFNQDMVGTDDVADGSEFTAFSAALATWQRAANTCSSLVLTEGPHISDRTIGWEEGSPLNRNVVIYRQRICSAVVSSSDSCWAEQSCQNKYDCWDGRDGTIAVTTTTYHPDTGHIYDADIEANDGNFFFTTVDSPPCSGTAVSANCVATDVQNTLTHELGHALGLAHSPSPTSTMFASSNPGEISKRVLDSGSQKFLCDAYPKNGIPLDCVALRAQSHLGEVTSGCAAAPGGVLTGLLLVGAGWTLAARRRQRR